MGLEQYGGQWRAAPIEMRTAPTSRDLSLRARVTCSRAPTGKVAAGARWFWFNYRNINYLFCSQGCDGVMVFVPFASVCSRSCKPFSSSLWQCPDSCGVVGRRHRDVQCVDSQSQRPLRPFHCQNVSSRPVSSLTCLQKPCVTWSISPWGPVGAIHTLKHFISVKVLSKDHYYCT